MRPYRRYPSLSVSKAIRLLRLLPTRLPYGDWLLVVSGIGNTFDIDIAEKILLTRFKDDFPGEHRKKLKNRLFYPDIRIVSRLATKYSGARTILRIQHTSIINQRSAKPMTTTTPQIGNSTFDRNANLFLHEGQIRILKDIEPYSPPTTDRFFRIGVNRRVKNKTTDYHALTFGFQNELLNAQQLAEVIKAGYAICPSHLIPDQTTGKIHRNSDSWFCSEVVILDIDTGTSLKSILGSRKMKDILLVYTTCSHTLEHNRFRIVLPTPGLIRDRAEYENLIRAYITEFNADPACSDVCRPFFGNTSAEIYFGEKYHD